MHSITVWKLAEQPNYNTNIDKVFPYSAVPYLGEYNLVKIPVSLNDLIHHVDYWGEGRVVSGEGVSGFSNCYNVNHQYQLVSSGPDRDRKIPNRIPVFSYVDCDSSAYIKENSVIIVTVAGAYINKSCAKDISRIINNDHGKAVVYGVQGDSPKILDLAFELGKKGLIACPDATLPSELQGLTYYDCHVAFVNIRTLADDLYNNVINGNYDRAVEMSKSFGVASGGEVITEIVMKLISAAPRNVMSYVYKLWHGGAKDIVRNHFPHSFQHIINEDAVTLVNTHYQQPLKLNATTDSYNDRLVWGDNARDKTSKRVSWKVIPVWSNDSVTFKLYNIDCNMYLKLDLNVDDIGDRKGWGSANSDEDRHRYYLEPSVENDTLVFYIINYRYKQGLKLELNMDRMGDRKLWGNNGAYNGYDRCRWTIEAWKPRLQE